MKPLIFILLSLCCSAISDCYAQSPEIKLIHRLYNAVHLRDTVTIRQLVHQGVNLSDSFFQPINYFIAIELNDLRGFYCLMDCSQTSEVAIDGESVIVRAIRTDRIDFVEALSSGIRYNRDESYLNYPTSMKMYSYLKREGAKPDVQTPFHLVDAGLYDALYQMLEENECTPFSKNAAGVTLLEYARTKKSKKAISTIKAFRKKQ